MSKAYFLKELEYLLSDLEAEEREEALQYYRDYLEEAGPEREAQVLAELGSPEKVAAQIRWGMDDAQDAGMFTERGYEDARFQEDHHMPDHYTEIVPSRKREKEHRRRTETQQRDLRRNRVVFLLLFLFVGLPLAGSILSGGFSLIAAILGGVFGILGGLIGLVFGGIALTVGLYVSSIVIFGYSVSHFTLTRGLIGIGIAFIMMAAGFLSAAVTKWGCSELLPGAFRFLIGFCRKLITGIAAVIRRIVGTVRGESK